VLTVLKESGCRPEDVRAVDGRHFDRAGRCWSLPKTEAKGKKFVRIVHLTDTAFEICERLLAKHPKGVLFRNRLGNAWTRHALDKPTTDTAGPSGVEDE